MSGPSSNVSVLTSTTHVPSDVTAGFSRLSQKGYSAAMKKNTVMHDMVKKNVYHMRCRPLSAGVKKSNMRSHDIRTSSASLSSRLLCSPRRLRSRASYILFRRGLSWTSLCRLRMARRLWPLAETCWFAASRLSSESMPATRLHLLPFFFPATSSRSSSLRAASLTIRCRSAKGNSDMATRAKSYARRPKDFLGSSMAPALPAAPDVLACSSGLCTRSPFPPRTCSCTSPVPRGS
mmetsp:Transcript_1755/g.6120  ORF Transcript_1755/g.6120 Transcript_1755/m.6120 type:complete len:235 (+) Transcript_1755:951-1655(+)